MHLRICCSTRKGLLQVPYTLINALMAFINSCLVGSFMRLVLFEASKDIAYDAD